MANKKNKRNSPKPVQASQPAPKKEQPAVAIQAAPAFDYHFSNKFLNNPYLPGLILLAIALIIGFDTYKDYGICWDEFYQRRTGMVSYDYVFNHKQDLMNYMDRQYGVGFELPLIFLEKWLGLTQLKDIYHMRHEVTHLFFLLSAFAGYVLVYRLFKNKILAIIGFMMLAFAPRLYAHSFFNTKDIPFLCVFLITLMVAQIAFEKDKRWLYLLLGVACGYTTSIRVMGIMLAAFIFFFLFLDWIGRMSKNNNPKEGLWYMLVFSLGFCVTLYIAWPYLWTDPIGHFTESYDRMSHFFLETKVLTAGEQMPSLDLPPTYFFIWFGVTNPVLWLLAGAGGIIWVLRDFIGKPRHFLANTIDRNFILYGLCFIVPVAAVLGLHSVLYDDWRQLYFIYPSFVLLGLYAIHKIYRSNLRWIMIGACAVQIGMVGYFMINYHPFQEVYFNELVSHDSEYLRKNYEMDYWGPCYKQALDYLLKKNPGKVMKISGNPSMYDPLMNNIQVLDSAQQRQFVYEKNPEQADYYITNFRFHPDDYLKPEYDEYTVKVLNSTVLKIYNLDKLYPQNQGH